MTNHEQQTLRDFWGPYLSDLKEGRPISRERQNEAVQKAAAWDTGIAAAYTPWGYDELTDRAIEFADAHGVYFDAVNSDRLVHKAWSRKEPEHLEYGYLLQQAFEETENKNS